MTSRSTTSHRSIGHRLHLRPRAGLGATALLIAGLALSGAAGFLGAELVEPAAAQTAGSRIDQPTAATMPDARDRPDGNVPAARALAPGTDVTDTGSTGNRVDPKDHLPDSMRRGH